MGDCAETLDPRVQVELERLNSATDEINRREVDLDEARLVFKQILAESHIKIQQHTKKLGSSIQKARPYYEARFKAHLASQDLQAAASALEKSNSAHAAAREMVYLAEQGLNRLAAESGEGTGVTLDPAWQEMLNHATARVNQAEAERSSAMTLHRVRLAQHRTATNAVQQLQASLKRHITKSRPYFEEKARMNSALEAQKRRVEALERGVAEAKLSYAAALRSLETISDEIHRHRSQYNESVHNGDNGTWSDDTKEESVMRWLQDPNSTHQDRNSRPSDLPQEFSDKQETPANGTPRSPHRADSDNWSDINLEGSSPEEIGFHKCTQDKQRGYSQLTSPESPEAPPTRVSAASPRRIIKPRAMSCVSQQPLIETKGTGGARPRLKAELPGWMKRDEATPRRQSLDVILNDTGERVREMLQGLSLFGSSGERRVSAPASPPRSPPRRLPSPLDRTLSYLSVNDSDDHGSDSESLASVEMLTEDQVRSLMLDPQLELCIPSN